MIDLENRVFTLIYNAVTAEYPNANVVGNLVERASVFPTVTVQEYDNTPHLRSLDDTNEEHNANLYYEVNVYSNKPRSQNKAEAKRIMNIVDGVLRNLKMTRRLVTRVPDVDRTIYRIYARYHVIVSEAEQVGNDVVHYMHRS